MMAEFKTKTSAAALTRDETDSLLVLVHLYMRLGDLDTAKLILKNIQQVRPDERQVLKYLAAVALEQDNPEKTLFHLAPLLRDAALSTRDAALLLMQARALWLLGREAESRNATAEYLTITGESS